MADHEIVRQRDAGISFLKADVSAATDPARAESIATLIWLSELSRDERLRSAVHLDGPESLRPTRTVGRFRLEALLGTGGYGAVFRAVDLESNETIAVKLAWPSILVDPETCRRFVDEPRTASALAHEGIVEVRESGMIDMICFIGLELIEGPTLAQWMAHERPVSIVLAATIIGSVAQAIQYAHERGVIHRDLKPSNILLKPAPGKGLPFVPKVSDFGLARRPPGTELSIFTETGIVIGTDPYLSPEQAAGNGVAVMEPSDIFSLGVILYELVAGQRPFEAANAAITREMIQNEDPAPMRRWRTDVPRDLETVILKCLEKSTDRRYLSTGALAEDLERFLTHQPIHARRMSLKGRCGKYARRNPMTIALASTVAIAMLVFAGLMVAWLADRMAAAEQLAAADNAERQHQYISNIQRAAEALRHGRRRDVIDLLEQCRAVVREPARRGIEWDLLWEEVNAAEQTLTAHPNGVAAVRFSPQGRLMASGGRDGKIVLWDTETWERRAVITYATEAEVSVVEFSTDGSLLAAAGEDGRLAVYRVEDVTSIYDEQVSDGRIFDLTWVGDGKQVALGGAGTTLSVVDPLTHERRRKELAISPEGRGLGDGHPEEISALVYIPDRNALAVFLNPSTSHFIDLRSFETLGSSLEGTPVVGAACRVHLDVDYLLSTIRQPAGGTVGIWRTTEPSLAGSFELGRRIRAMRFSPISEAVAIAFRDGAIQTYNVQDLLGGRPATGKRFLAHSDRAVSVDWSPDGSLIASGGWDGGIKLWSASHLCGLFDLPLAGQSLSLAFSPCGRWLAVSVESPSNTCTLTVYDARERVPLWSTTVRFRINATLRNLFCFGPTGDEVAVVDSPRLCIHDAFSGKLKCEYSIPSSDRPISRLQYTPEGNSILLNQSYAPAVMIDRRKATIDRFGDPTDNYLGVFTTVLGDMLITSSDSRELTLRATASSAEKITLAAPNERIDYVVVSRDGRYVAGGGVEGPVYFWDLEQPAQLRKLVGHEASVMTIAFSNDGNSILTCANDGTVRIWHRASGDELLRFGTPQRPVHSMALNPAGTMLVLGVKEGDQHGLEIHRLSGRNVSRTKNSRSESPKSLKDD